eukprot:79123-Hanusia_phi.AAC.2
MREILLPRASARPGNSVSGLGELTRGELPVGESVSYPFDSVMLVEPNRTWGWAIPNEEIIREIVNVLRARKGSILVDFGCGRGFWSYLISREYPSAAIIAVDKNEALNPCLIWPPCNTFLSFFRVGIKRTFTTISSMEYVR